MGPVNSDNIGNFDHDQCDMQVHMPFMEECASRAGTIVEIGVGHGNGSTRAFARGLKRSASPIKMHIGVDWDPVRPQVVPNENWAMVHGPSESVKTLGDVMALLMQNLMGSPDIIFIDTIHTHEQMSMEMPLWGKIAGPNTLWLYHDTWMFGVYNHMSEAIKEWAAANPGWEYLDQSKLAHGMGVLRHKDGPWGWIEPRVEEAPVAQV